MSYFSGTACQIWMGSLEPHMTEHFVMAAFKASGEPPLKVKIMKEKMTNVSAGYCFVHFESDERARMVLHKLNGKVIPNTNPPVKFKLNYAGSSSKPYSSVDNEYSLFVGDLSPDVDDYILYKCFSAKYKTVRTAKVVHDSSGFSKGYAFVRFASEAEQKKCAVEMNGYLGLGTKPIKIGSAIPRTAKKEIPQMSSSNTIVPTYDYSQTYYDPTAAWQSYSWQSNYYHQQMLAYASFYPTPTYEGNDDMELIEHTTPINVDELNQAVLGRDCDFWDSIEGAQWSPVEAV